MEGYDPRPYGIFDGKVYPCVISIARYSGIYERGEWVAFQAYEVPEFVYGDDLTCSNGYESYPLPIGRGNTPNEAAEDLKRRLTDGR